MKSILIGLVLLFSSSAIYTKPVEYSKFAQEEIYCLAANIHHESRGEPIRGQIAVAHVTLNRVKSNKFPKTICKVVKQPGQFSWYKGTKITSTKISVETYILALEVLSGKYKDPTRGSLYFHNATVGPFDRKEKTRIGAHIFYG